MHLLNIMLRHHTSLFGLSLTVFLLAMALSSCASRHTAAILNDVDTYIQQRPDSALATIRAIDTTTLTSRSLRAHYALLHAMALDKNWIDTTDVGVVMPAVEYYDRHPSDIRRAKAWYYLGRIQQNAGDRPEASISLMKAERYAERSDDFYFKGLIFQSLASIYSQTHLHEEALKYSERTYSLFVESKDTLNANAALLGIAHEYYNLGMNAEADSLFCLLIDGSQVHPNLRSDLLSSYALSCVTQDKDYEMAIRLFEEALSSTGSLKNRNLWGAYAYALMRIGNTKRAEQLFRQLENNKNSSQLYVYDYWKSMADAYSGDYLSAFLLQKAASDIQNENVKKAFRQSAIKAQKDFLEEVNRESEIMAHRRKIVTLCTISSLLFIIILFTFFIRRRIKQTAQEKEYLMKAFNELTSQTEEEKARIRGQYIKMCQSHFSHIGRINEMLNYHSSDANNSLYQELKASMKRIGSDEQKQREFESMLNDTFDNAMAHFREDFPKKKPRYYQFVSFLVSIRRPFVLLFPVITSTMSMSKSRD